MSPPMPMMSGKSSRTNLVLIIVIASFGESITSLILSCVALNFSSKASKALTASGLYCTISTTVFPSAVSSPQPDSSAAEARIPARRKLPAVFMLDFIKMSSFIWPAPGLKKMK